MPTECENPNPTDPVDLPNQDGRPDPRKPGPLPPSDPPPINV